MQSTFGSKKLDRDSLRTLRSEWETRGEGTVMVFPFLWMLFSSFKPYQEIFSDSTLGVRGEGLYHFTPNLAGIAGLGLSDKDRTANIGARWYFTPTTSR